MKFFYLRYENATHIYVFTCHVTWTTWPNSRIMIHKASYAAYFRCWLILYSRFISLGVNFPEQSVLSFSRNFPNLEIHDPNQGHRKQNSTSTTNYN